MNDTLYDKAVMVAKAANPPSIANIQRTLLIGYNRASRLMDAMIDNGILERVQYPNCAGYRVKSSPTEKA